MEDLTKQQMVLLTLLVSFVTSIATGIITVSLMTQVPQTVTQTINRVVERTIEKVTPAESQTTVTKETIVVKEEDQVVEVIDKNSKAIVRIYSSKTDEAGVVMEEFVSLGAIVSEDGKIVTDNYNIYPNTKYVAIMSDSSKRELETILSKNGDLVAFMKLLLKEGEDIKFTTVKISGEVPKLGQSVVFIGGESKNSILTGIVSGINTKDIKVIDTTASTTEATSTPDKFVNVISSIDTNISDKLTSGGILLNLSGDVIGVRGYNTDTEKNGQFISAETIDGLYSKI